MFNHPNLVFSLDEYKRRISFVREQMKQQGVELAIFTDQEHLTYLTGHQTSGYDSFQALLIPSTGECFSFTRVLEESNFLQRTWVTKTFTYLDTENPVQKLIELIRDHNTDSKSLGLELDSFFLRRDTIETLRDNFKQKEIINISRILDPIRRVKSSEELELMKKVAHITEEAMLAGIEASKVGVTENEIAAKVHEAMYLAGGEYPSVPPYIVTGERTNIGHGTWEQRKVQKGDCVFLELAGCLQRYHTAMMRTLVIGPAPKEMLEAEKIALEALAQSMENMKPGVSVGEIASANRDIIASNQCGGWQTGRSGYGIGISFAPAWDEGHLVSLNPVSNQLLEENMTIHLIPFFMMPKIKMIMGISETVVVTPNGAKSLFDRPERKLIIKD